MPRFLSFLISSLQHVFLGMVALLVCSAPVMAEPFAAPGDLQLRHDLEYLADRGLMRAPITSWPMTWADIASAVASVDPAIAISPATQAVILRLENKIAKEIRWGIPQVHGEIALSENRTPLRTFQDVPRGSVELTGTLDYVGASFAGKLSLTLIDTNEDDNNFQWDDSYLAYIWGNTAISIGAQPQWWGPGHTGSMIFSNNARPVPGLSVKRNVAKPFNHRWLRWIGPWSGQIFAGQLEDDRFVSNAYLLGARVVIKPRPSLELGVSRTAQWGGSGRPETFSTLVDLIIGQDNVGDGVTREDEPGNQLAGFDARFSTSIFRQPLTFYGQIIGEDEAGGFPSRYMGQLGLSTSMPVHRIGSTLRINLEYSDSTCQFYESSRLYNCAYNHPIYRDGYRFRGRSIGFSTDNDAQQFALVGTLNGPNRTSWATTLKGGTLNRGGNEDPRNTVTATPVDFVEFELSHTRPFYQGHLDAGVGFRRFERSTSMDSDNEVQVFLKWSSKEY